MTSPAAAPRPFVRRFNPVVVRHRNDGWTPAKQVRFIEALAESACVIDACRDVGMSAESAYTLRRRYDAVDFRLSWDAALDYAVQRVSEGAIGRAIHGVAVPHYYKGAIVGEHRRFNEALTMFILRYRDPSRYAKHWDGRAVVQTEPEEAAQRLAVHLDAVATGASDERHAYENDVIEKAAVIATDEELEDLGKTQYDRGVPAAVEAAIRLMAMYDREADAEERAGIVVHDAPDPAVAARFADVLALKAAEVERHAEAAAQAAARATAEAAARAEAAAEAAAREAAEAEEQSDDTTPGAAPAFHPDMASSSSTSAPGEVPAAAPASPASSQLAQPSDPPTGPCDPKAEPTFRPWYPLPKPKWPPGRSP